MNDKNELSGELALIQLKSRQSIPWTEENYFTLTGIDIATSNYWYKFAVPVFVFLADIDHKELYFVSVNYYIKRNFYEFTKQKVFNYKIEKSSKFEGKNGVFAFKFHFYYEHYRQQFENELLFFLSNLSNIKNFQAEHDNRDFHMPVESTDLIFFEAMHRNFSFLCTYLNIDNAVPSLRKLKEKSREKFPNGAPYELFEDDLNIWMPHFGKLTLTIISELKIFLAGEMNYWMFVNRTLYNYVTDIKEDGQLPDW